MTGREAYEADCRAKPTYPDGTTRKAWDQLSNIARWSWEREPNHGSGAWYDQTPASYAEGLRWRADRSIETAIRKREEAAGTSYAPPKPWAVHDAEHFERQARRLLAMALLCDKSDAARAGSVDFLGMSDPTQNREEEDAAIAEAQGECQTYRAAVAMIQTTLKEGKDGG